MIHSFVGYYNAYGLRALGCTYILKKDFILINYLMGVLRLRHLFKENEKERKKWEDPYQIKNLPYEMQAVTKLCLLPNDELFLFVIRFYL